MEENQNNNMEKDPGGFKGYAIKRITVGVLLTFAVLWIFGTLLGFFDSPDPLKTTVSHETSGAAAKHGESVDKHSAAASPEKHATEKGVKAVHGSTADHGVKPDKTDSHAAAEPSGHASSPSGADSHSSDSHAASADSHSTGRAPEPDAVAGHGKASSGPAASHQKVDDAHGESHTAATHDQPKGVAFINAAITPLRYELEERFWGWRPNDILDFTDNVNHFQLGVLEVTRRTTVALTERISRTGSADSFDPNLENAMNWFMIKSDRYWFPSPESKYEAGLKELTLYREKLKKGTAHFYTRTDNLIPLLKAYENLLGSCDENLVKEKEDDGTHVSYFKADDYFFYAQGVASAMHSVLEAIHSDFHNILDSRRGTELLHHAILSCEHAMHTHPILVTNSSMSGILANHRANLAASISHARFYLGMLIETLST